MTSDLQLNTASADADPLDEPGLRETADPTPMYRRDLWRRRYRRNLALTDLFSLVWVVYGTQILWFGLENAQVAAGRDVRISDLSYWVFSAILIVTWMWALSFVDSRSDRVVGTGSAEYVRIADASFRLFGTVAIIAFLTQIDVARGYLLISLPLGILVLIFTRWMWRQWLVVQRSRGLYSANVLLVGSLPSVTQLAREFGRSPSAGYRVVGACVPNGQIADVIPGTAISVMGHVGDVTRALQVTGADTVAITSADDLPADKVKQISGSLEAGRQHLVLAPNIIDIVGPRLHTRPVAGLPLIHVETPRFARGRSFRKRSVELFAASVGVILLSPLLVFLMITVRLSSDGPVFFRQTRVGFRGREFTMIKFRSLVVNAEDLLEQLAAQERDSGNEVLFKMKTDPRVTPIGRVMRNFSLDELPQLFDVIGGSMSLVGPRPPLPSEVAVYAGHVHRRFLAKPGTTGLWQASGRSSLSWDGSVRLDLSYVETWTLLGDFVILGKTARAALAPGETAA